MRWNRKWFFFFIAETAHRASSTEAAYSQHSIAIHSISIAGYVTPVPAFLCGKLPGRKASSLCDFWKLTLLRFHPFFSFLTQVNPFFLQMCLIKITLANLCRNMINFDAVDFSECCSEEVLFWRSVYIHFKWNYITLITNYLRWNFNYLVLVLVLYCTQRPGGLSRYSGQGHLWQQQLNFKMSFVDQTTYVHVGQDCFKLVKVGGCLYTIW